MITAEKMVCEEEKYYPMMHVQHGHMEELADIEWKYGAFLLKEKNPVLGSFLKKEETTLTGVLQNLRQQPKERVKERILEIESLLALNRKAQKWMKTVVARDHTQRAPPLFPRFPTNVQLTITGEKISAIHRRILG